MSLRVTHKTTYLYSEAVSLSYHLALLTPRETPTQTVREHRLSIAPAASDSRTRTDRYGNQVTMFAIAESHTALRVESTGIVTSWRGGRIDPLASPSLERLRERLRRHENPDDLAAYEFCFDSPHAPLSEALADFAAPCFPSGRPFLVGVHELNHRVFREFRYDPAVTTISTPVEEVLEKRHGVCQDFAHLTIAALRSIGVAARYVSGYIAPGPHTVGAQASHAWLSVYVPDHGWLDFDPTNDTLPAGEHVTLAWGRDFSDVSPLRGVVLGGAEHSVLVEVHVEPCL